MLNHLAAATPLIWHQHFGYERAGLFHKQLLSHECAGKELIYHIDAARGYKEATKTHTHLSAERAGRDAIATHIDEFSISMFVRR
jgi:hypothetical protein